MRKLLFVSRLSPPWFSFKDIQGVCCFRIPFNSCFKKKWLAILTFERQKLFNLFFKKRFPFFPSTLNFNFSYIKSISFIAFFSSSSILASVFYFNQRFSKNNVTKHFKKKLFLLASTWLCWLPFLGRFYPPCSSEFRIANLTKHPTLSHQATNFKGATKKTLKDKGAKKEASFYFFNIFFSKNRHRHVYLDCLVCCWCCCWCWRTARMLTSQRQHQHHHHLRRVGGWGRLLFSLSLACLPYIILFQCHCLWLAWGGKGCWKTNNYYLIYTHTHIHNPISELVVRRGQQKTTIFDSLKNVLFWKKNDFYVFFI